MSRPEAAAVFTGRAMGSPLRLTTVGLSRAQAADAWRVVTAEFEASEHSLSRWRADSGLSRLNAAAGSGTSAPADRHLIAFLVASARAQRVSGGRFDPRVLTRLEALGERAGVPLRGLPDELGSDRPWLACDPRRGQACLAAAVDSGGIGKGLGLRWAAGALAHAALLGTGLLLEAGGDLVVHGERAGGGPWQVGVEDPAGGDEPLAVISSTHGAIATSSTAVRNWTSPDGARVHHLIDPSTGEPGGDGLLAVTVAMADPAWAEVWSKTLFLAGARAIGDEARRRGLAAWWVEDDGSLHLTPAARQQTAWTRAERAA
ncbi:MAG: FAD:protein FMN transferase [Chloroflexota bacterium]|nr:FAD:protein FMN transferase [Chloroflexota bacterium]